MFLLVKPLIPSLLYPSHVYNTIAARPFSLRSVFLRVRWAIRIKSGVLKQVPAVNDHGLSTVKRTVRRVHTLILLNAHLSVSVLVACEHKSCLCHVLLSTRPTSRNTFHISIIVSSGDRRFVRLVGVFGCRSCGSHTLNHLGVNCENALVISEGNIPGAMLLTRTWTPYMHQGV
jgi:hypothetical protein